HTAFLHVCIAELVHSDDAVVREQSLFITFQSAVAGYAVALHIGKQGDYGPCAFLVAAEFVNSLDYRVRTSTDELINKAVVTSALPEVQRPYSLLFFRESRKVSQVRHNH